MTGYRRRHYAAGRWLGAVTISAFVVLMNVASWRLGNPQQPAPDVLPRVAGLAYNAFQRWDSPTDHRSSLREAMVDDLRLVSGITDRIRTYGAADYPELPLLAEQFNLRLTFGVWLDRRLDNNAREIAVAIAAARQHRSIERIIAGNETLLHRKVEPEQLHAYLDELRAALEVPVSTAEPWHVWLEQPELADHVDFITLHLLPYWEGVPLRVALDVALHHYDQVRARFPDKRVMIGEIGWPSGGATVGAAEATPAAQAMFVRTFLADPRTAGLDYFFMEAIDQPWKQATEGPVGAYWGFLDARRQPKFGFTGPIEVDPYWLGKAAASSLFGLLVVLHFLLKLSRMSLPGRVMFALVAQGVVSLAVLLATLPLVHYLGVIDVFMMAALVPTLIIMAIILLTQTFEFAEMFWEGSLIRQAKPQPLPAGYDPPLVSIHLPCCNEPPDMLIASIDSLLALDWPALEILIIDNNTEDAAKWQPVAEHVERRARELGNRAILTFFHLPAWPGYKAGALNFSLAQTDPRAQWIGVVDADYRVHTDWLRMLSGYFVEPAVGIVQAPQAHRNWEGRRFWRMMNWEYEGFFRIGMHHRHERDAIVQHGTMTLVRAAALREAGGWDEQCIVEDTELGLRLMRQGLSAVYVDHVFGAGLVPHDFGAYRRQRRRWAQGAMQILRRHAGALLRRSSLSPGQRYHFVAGWLLWLGDALHLVFSFAAIAWTIGILTVPDQFTPPLALFALPLVVFFCARLLMGPLLYWRRVKCPPADIAGAALAGMGLSHTIARGIMAGLIGRELEFQVTRRSADKCDALTAEKGKSGVFADVREEAGLLAALLSCIVALAVTQTGGGIERGVWMMVLGMQALPYLAVLLCAQLSRQGD